MRRGERRDRRGGAGEAGRGGRGGPRVQRGRGGRGARAERRGNPDGVVRRHGRRAAESHRVSDLLPYCLRRSAPSGRHSQRDRPAAVEAHPRVPLRRDLRRGARLRRRPGAPAAGAYGAHPAPAPADCSAFFPAAADDWMQASEDTGVVLAVLPRTASCLWAAASKLNLLAYPWWYLGTDGVAALDLMDAAPESGEEMLGGQLEYELALAPSAADPSGEEAFAPFRSYWQQQSYAAFPGLLTFDAAPHFSTPRPFVPHLIDAVWAFHEAFNKTVGENGSFPSTSQLLACFNDSPADCVSFAGTTGHVHFDSDSGERSKLHVSPRYSLMQFAGLPWMPVGEWVEQQQPRLNLTQQTPLMRPADPAGDTSSSTGEVNGSLTGEVAPPASNSSSSGGGSNGIDGTAGGSSVRQSATIEPTTAATDSTSGGSSSSTGSTIAIAVVCSAMLVALIAIVGAMLWSKRQHLFVHEEPKHHMVADDADVARGGVHLL
ncbi:hypothetical protein CLOP_g13447 [Closterium sp. NIES-67]|nr:hypothetical protein CLOP_g13447 [Closterium sp. NIES-67]